MGDLKRALREPGAEYDSPEQVAADIGLSIADRLRVLRRWEHDLVQLETADEEGMLAPAGGTQPGGRHQAVRRQIVLLEGVRGSDPSVPDADP